MVRAKTPNQSKGKEKKKSVVETLRYELPHNYRVESFADKKLKNIPANDSELFICKLFENRFEEKFSKRAVVLGKPPNYKELTELPRLQSLFDVQHWNNLFQHHACCNYLVRLFYANLHSFEDEFGDLIVRSYVKGKQIELSASTINDLFDLEDGGWCITLKDVEVENNEHSVDRQEVNSFLFRGGIEGPNSMDIYGRAVAMIVVQYIQCRAGKDMTESDYILTYKVMKQEKINFGDVMVHNIDLTGRSKTRKLPYGQLLTRILELHGVTADEGEEVVSTHLFFGYRNLHAILGKRKREDEGCGLEQGVQNNENEQVTNVCDNSALLKKIEKVERRMGRMKQTLKLIKRQQRQQTASMEASFEKIMTLLQQKEIKNTEVEVCDVGRTDVDENFEKETINGDEEVVTMDCEENVGNVIAQIVDAINAEEDQHVTGDSADEGVAREVAHEAVADEDLEREVGHEAVADEDVEQEVAEEAVADEYGEQAGLKGQQEPGNVHDSAK